MLAREHRLQRVCSCMGISPRRELENEIAEVYPLFAQKKENLEVLTVNRGCEREVKDGFLVVISLLREKIQEKRRKESGLKAARFFFS